MAAPNHLNVLVIVNRLFEWSQNFITRELVELSRQGVTLHVGARRIVPRDDLTTEEDHILDRYLRVPENPFLPSYFFRHALFNLKHPINYLRAWKELFTFGHRQPSKWGRSLVCLFRAAAIADEVIKREINLIHAHFMTAPAETALYLSVLTGVPFGCTAHAMDIYKDNSGLSKKMQKADYVTTCTEANLEFLNQRFPAHREKTFRVYHGIAAGGHNSNRGLSESPVAFLAVGRLSPKKGFNYLLDACQILKTRNSNFRCLIVGEGPL
ncbi:MAG TPA: glycosyltransferase, partial [bacterium]